jgi:hypothetical protein
MYRKNSGSKKNPKFYLRNPAVRLLVFLTVVLLKFQIFLDVTLCLLATNSPVFQMLQFVTLFQNGGNLVPLARTIEPPNPCWQQMYVH